MGNVDREKKVVRKYGYYPYRAFEQSRSMYIKKIKDDNRKTTCSLCIGVSTMAYSQIFDKLHGNVCESSFRKPPVCNFTPSLKRLYIG